MHYTVGCDPEGRLTAVKVRLIGDKGAYASVGSKVIERACGHATGAYDVANVDVEGQAASLGKTPGKDAAAGKPTYPMLYGLAASRHLAADCLARARAALDAVDLGDSWLFGIGRWIVERSN